MLEYNEGTVNDAMGVLNDSRKLEAFARQLSEELKAYFEGVDRVEDLPDGGKAVFSFIDSLKIGEDEVPLTARLEFLRGLKETIDKGIAKMDKKKGGKK